MKIVIETSGYTPEVTYKHALQHRRSCEWIELDTRQERTFLIRLVDESGRSYKKDVVRMCQILEWIDKEI